MENLMIDCFYRDATATPIKIGLAVHLYPCLCPALNLQGETFFILVKTREK